MRFIYTIRDRHGESQEVIVCPMHVDNMPAVDGDQVSAAGADADCSCEFCAGRQRVVRHIRKARQGADRRSVRFARGDFT